MGQLEQPMAETIERVRRAAACRAAAVGDEWEPPEEVAEARAMGYDALRTARWGAAIPARFAWSRLGDFGVEADPVRRWVAADGPRPNLVVGGPVGSGKTHLAVAAVRPDHDRGLEVRFWPVAELLDLLRPGGPPSALYDLADVDRLVIDDLGQERPTDWTAERLSALVNRRWLEERPTIATTNLTLAELRDRLGAPTFSRLVGSGATTVALTGDDRRRRARGAR